MPIELTRIDDKLIHAQMIWGWVPLIQPSLLIVVNDGAANDELKKKILLTAAEPALPYTRAKIYSLEEVLESDCLNEDSEEKVLLVLGKPADVAILINNGINIIKVSLGYMSERPGKKKILDTVFVDDEDINAFRNLVDIGVELVYQVSPLAEPMDARNWFNSYAEQGKAHVH